ncbi:MAG: diacylglycerol kinase family lipid kinase [Bacilli bacterium]|nr:diacylglycerol kinase family lipid kinase [Bacilli bacterium]
MKYIFIINPVSGNKNHSQIIRNIHDYMEDNELEYEIFFTEYQNHATEIALNYAKEKKVIIYSVGGDGTLNEIVNGLAKSKVKLGVIPAGSGNDFYRSLETLKRKNIKIDLGLVNDKYFINIASIGIDAEVSKNAEIFKKLKFPKKSIYDFSILYTFLKFKYQNINISYNNKSFNTQKLIVAICNGKYYGGGYKIAPLASFDDNYFDVYFAEKTSKLKIPELINMLKKSEHEKSSLVRKERLKSITIYSDKNIICSYDGEYFMSKKLEFKLIKNVINIHNDKQLVNYILTKK